jgi:hypothetical protein
MDFQEPDADKAENPDGSLTSKFPKGINDTLSASQM